MKKSKLNIENLFLLTALFMLLLGLCFGLLATVCYISPHFLKEQLGFISLRPLHVSSALFWIIIGATGCVYGGLKIIGKGEVNPTFAILQWFLWLMAIAGILKSYFNHEFGGREYWEFSPEWALPVVLAWLCFVYNFFRVVRKIKVWPVYVWMWLTGIVFFLFTFLENYLWVFPYFRSHFITDMTLQWKVNGSLVGSWNQIIYGTAFFLMDRMEGSQKVGRSKMAFAMYFLGLFNLMFNWGHHIYTLPTEPFIRYVGYVVSMTEWIFFLRIIYSWRQTLADIQKNYHYFPYRFLMASEFWIFLNMGQALLMSIPAINLYTHGTHVTVAHAMGTTIGINSMILFAACFEFLNQGRTGARSYPKFLRRSFWLLQISLLVFWLSLNLAGIKKALWQMSDNQMSYSRMMDTLHLYFSTFFLAGTGLFISIALVALFLIYSYFSHRTESTS